MRKKVSYCEMDKLIVASLGGHPSLSPPIDAVIGDDRELVARSRELRRSRLIFDSLPMVEISPFVEVTP